MSQRELELLGECLGHFKAQDFGGLGKRVSCGKSGGPLLTIYTSCDVFLHKEVPYFAGLTTATDTQTDRPTDHATRSVTICRIYAHAVLRCGLINGFSDVARY